MILGRSRSEVPFDKYLKSNYLEVSPPFSEPEAATLIMYMRANGIVPEADERFRFEEENMPVIVRGGDFRRPRQRRPQTIPVTDSCDILKSC